MRYLFEDYAFDTDRRELHRGADVVSIAPQVFDLLHYLIRNRERVVSKDDLINAVWNGRSVSDAALTTRLNVARSVIGDSGEEQRLIKTLPRKGFRFVGQVREARDAARPNPGEAAHENALAVPDKPSIAVLPFENMSGDPEQEYFADGMVEDIITGLSRSKSLFVISRLSSFTYRGKSVEIKQVGRELGVRYVLEGSVRKAGSRVRITGQLVDATTGNHVWADRYDSTLEDIFDLQDRVTMSVIGAIVPQLERAEIARAQRKPTESLQAYDYYLRALANFYRFTPEAIMEALELTRTATHLDPEFAAAFALGAGCLLQRWGFGWSGGDAGEINEELREARRLARQALELDKDDPAVITQAGLALVIFPGELEEGAALLARAVSLNPNLAIARTWSGYVYLLIGDKDAAIEQFQISMRLSPLDPHIFMAQNGIANAHFLAGRYEEGCLWAKTAAHQNPNYVGAHRMMMACHAMAGRTEEARRAWAIARQLYPSQRISTFIKRWPFSPKDLQLYAEGFRRAGMPE